MTYRFSMFLPRRGFCASSITILVKKTAICRYASGQTTADLIRLSRDHFRPVGSRRDDDVFPEPSHRKASLETSFPGITPLGYRHRAACIRAKERSWTADCPCMRASTQPCVVCPRDGQPWSVGNCMFILPNLTKPYAASMSRAESRRLLRKARCWRLGHTHAAVWCSGRGWGWGLGWGWGGGNSQCVVCA